MLYPRLATYYAVKYLILIADNHAPQFYPNSKNYFYAKAIADF